MPLAMVGAGRRVRLLAVDAGCGLQGRLASMGLVPGVEIEVLRNSMRGPFLIAVKGSRIMMGRGMAQKIMVA
ncbi:MAG: ferrous iron transport protein A [Deltaproteobacteria bacterium]|nr:ferrous iron transport protein A [Deltaproteobacteria bacterium]